jgi:hypothetical protein
MKFSMKTYKKSQRRLRIRLKVGLWMVRRGHGNVKLLSEVYIPRNIAVLLRVNKRMNREFNG